MAIQNQYGLGFSPLSTKYVKEYAYDQESVANKEVGLYGIVNGEDRNIISADYVARSKAQMESFVNRMIADNTIGKIWKITVDDGLVRTINNNTTNLLEDSNCFINNGTQLLKGVRFNIDLDLITKAGSALQYNGNIDVAIIMTLSVGAYSVRQAIEYKEDGTPYNIADINSTAFALDYTGIERAVGDVVLTFDSIVIKPSDSFDYDVNTLALYDILVATIPMASNS